MSTTPSSSDLRAETKADNGSTIDSDKVTAVAELPQPSAQQPPPYRLLAVLLTLYFAQGLPSGFITQALPAILRSYQVSLEMIGWSGLLLAPWALKFLWAPIVDKYFSPRMGRSRSWILPLQLASAAIVMGVGLFDPTKLADPVVLWSFYALLLLLSLVGATHDVAADGLATRSLTTHRATTGIDDDITEVIQNPHQGMGNAVQVIGYRLGLILGGGVFLMVVGLWSWQLSFFAMAILIILNTIPIWRFAEVEAEAKKRASAPVQQPVMHPAELRTAKVAVDVQLQAAPKQRISSILRYLKSQYGYFWQDKLMRAWLAVLLTYKIVDGISSGMVKPMMVDMGISTAKIGLWASVLGSVASLLGAGIAAWLLKRMAHQKALFWFNALQVLATGLYALVAISFEHGWHPNGAAASTPFWWAYMANAIEHMVAAMALVAMLTMVMHYARHDKAGSDFTTQVCLLTVFSGSTHLISGYLAQWLGYSGHFILSVLIGIGCLLPLWYWRRLFEQNVAIKQL